MINLGVRNELRERDQHWGGSNWLQKIDYLYNDQSWLTQINGNNITGTNIVFPICTTSVVNPGVTTVGQDMDQKDLFYMQLQYDNLFSGVSGTLRKDGNISQAIWRVRGRARQAYSYAYDGLQRISSANYSDIADAGTVTASGTYNTSYTYADLRGNISNNVRSGLYLSGACYTPAVLDNMTYTYTSGTNKISSITDAALSTQGGFRASSGAFTYDVNGNMISNAAKGITSIAYNHLNLPTNITLSGSRTIDFTYTADGTKLKKVVKTGATVNLTQDYISGIEYKNSVIEGIYHAEGRLYNNAGTWQREYTIKDHLGDSRIAYCDINNDGVIATPSEILQENNYDAFGYGLDGVYMNHSNPDNLYQYNGKEKNDDHGIGMYDYGARWYDAGVGRFSSKDPMASKYSMLSPYAFVANNPMRFIDPDGNDIVDPKGKHVQITYKKDGTLGFSKNATSDIQRVANALNSTETGRGQLKNVDKSNVHVKINISSETKVNIDGNKTAYTYGETEQGNKNNPPSFGQHTKKDGSLGISVAKITIFEGSINEGIKEGSGLKLEGLTMDQAIGAVAGHEIVHASDQSEINKDLKDSQGKPRKDDREAKPNKVEYKIIEESKKSNN